ncbi:MAG: hypothetical protein QM608_05475 [Caulobacter sp.]
MMELSPSVIDWVTPLKIGIIVTGGLAAISRPLFSYLSRRSDNEVEKLRIHAELRKNEREHGIKEAVLAQCPKKILAENLRSVLGSPEPVKS